MSDTISILAVADPAVNAYVEKQFQIISSYEEKTGERIIFDIIPWNDYYSTLMAVFNGEKNYDVVMIAGHLWLKDFVTKGYLAPVSYPNAKDWDEADILPVIREEMKIDGVPYLYPSFCDGHLVLYRKSIVSEVMQGLLPEVISTDTLIDAVSRCHGYQGKMGIALKAHPSEIFLDVLPYLRNEGVEVFRSSDHQPDFNNEQGILALSKYMGLKKYALEDTHRYGNDEVREAFQQGKSIFAVTWGGQLGVVLDERCQCREDIGFSALKTSWNVTWSFGISAQSPNKSRANAFLSYLASKKVDRMIGGYAGSPVRASTYEADSKKYPWYPTHLRLIKDYARPLPQMDQAGDITGIMYRYISEAFEEKISLAECLKQAEEKIRALRAKEVNP